MAAPPMPMPMPMPAAAPSPSPASGPAGQHTGTMLDMMFDCNGVHPDGYGGEWQGHVLPGTLFIVWGLHWLQGSMRHYFSAKSKGVPFVSKACYDLPGTPRWPLEAYFVVVLTSIALTLELVWHNDGYSRLICPPGTPRAGHFDAPSLNNWQHANMYFCFIVSGLVDIVAYHCKLPPGTDKAFLSLAFLGEAALMGLHEKHDPLNQILHQCLALTMLACCGATAAEAVWPTSFLATCARVAATLWQGLMFWVVAQIVYVGGKAWDQSPTDQLPAQYAAVAIVQSVCAVLGIHVAVFLVWNALHLRGMALQPLVR